MLQIPINEQGWGLIFRLIREFVGSAVGAKAIGLFGTLIGMLFAVNGLNILTSYVGRDFMTAIADRNRQAYLAQAVIYVGVFAASTFVAVFLRYAEERLGLVWREWMTQRFVGLYLQYPTYYRMNDAVMKSAGIEHPDQRIADDIRAFTTTALSFTLILLNGIFTVVAFSGVLWTISPLLFVVAVLYAAIGSYLTFALGHSLIDLTYDQLDKEASFRSSLLHVRENAESLALLHRERRLLSRLLAKFDELTANFRRIILVNRRLGFFTTGYNYLAQLIPILLVAPLFIQGNAEFGVITQSAMAFAMLVGAFSLIVTQFQSLSAFAAVTHRVVNLWYAIELAQTETASAVDVSEDDERVAYENLTLFSSVPGDVHVRTLSVSIPRGTRVLVTAPDDATKNALFKGTAGIVDAGVGRVIRPRRGQILFLPGRPYLPLGTLRETLIPEELEAPMPDEKVIATLRALHIDTVLTRTGGLDTEQDWESILSVYEQQLLSFARILLASPRFAVIDLESMALNAETIARLLKMLTTANISYLIVGRQGQQNVEVWLDCYDAVLDVKVGGSWEWQVARRDG